MITAVNEFLDDLRGGRMTEAPVVTVEQGQLQGKVVSSPTGKAFYSFQGIPYAKPPLGSLRFKAPQPPELWDGIRDATAEGNICAQIDILNPKGFMGDENCLFLNIYTTNLDGAFLPVMVYIHGGGFISGSGNTNMYGADYLVEKDVVVVTLNYRCGVLGFLGLNTPEVPGNAGLKDIVQALRWVKENIQNFGGNPGNLTVFGESAGGVAVSLLTASPLTKNLIGKAIIQSGTALCDWVFQENPLESARSIAKELGCDSGEPDEILEFLAATPAKDLVETHLKLNGMNGADMAKNLFGLVVEKEFPGVEAFITEPFIDILTSGRIADIPTMIGSATLELAFERKSDDLQIHIPQELNITRDSDEALAIVEKIKELYLSDEENQVGYYQFISDRFVNISTHRHIQYLVKATNKPIYYYKFDYVGEFNLSPKMMFSMGLKRAMHLDELGYLFKNDQQKEVEPTPQDVKMRERMLRLWTNFAKCGNPTPEENHYINVTWLPVTKDNLYYLNLGTELTLDTSPDKEKMDFWDELYSKYYRIWDHPKTNTEEVVIKSEPIIVSHTLIETVTVTESAPIDLEPVTPIPEPVTEIPEPVTDVPEPITEVPEPVPEVPEPVFENERIPETGEVIEPVKAESPKPIAPTVVDTHVNGVSAPKLRLSNEIKMAHSSNGAPKDVIRANDPPEDDLPKNIGVNKFVNFFESLGGKK